MKPARSETIEPASCKYAVENRGVFKRHHPAIMPIALAAWITAVLAGLFWILNASNIPGRQEGAPAAWPSNSRIPLDGALPTLVVFAHPRCPCTRATLGELEALVAECGSRVRAHVLFVKPDGAIGDWDRTELWRKAAGIDGVTVHTDLSGFESRLFHSTTSGHTVLYQPDGRLVFQGGITLSRGHAGNNPGREGIAGFLGHRIPGNVKTPVFGCPLSNPGISPEAIAWKR